MKKIVRKILKVFAIAALILFCGICAVSVWLYIGSARTVQESGREVFSERENSYIYDNDKEVLAKLNTGEDRVYLKYEDIPEQVIHAFIAVEDQRFYYHPGVDVIGIFRSMAVYVTSGGDTLQGGSTITQQLARTVFLSNEVTLERKVKEIFLALALEMSYSKEDILEFYINNVYFANGTYGIEAAARSYFGRSCDELDVSETAFLCAIPNSPTWYNPRTNPEHTRSRRDKILKDMEEQGYLTAQETEEAMAEKQEVLEKDRVWNNSESTYALDCAVRYLMEKDGFTFCSYFRSEEEYKSYRESYEQAYEKEKERVYRGKFKIYTALDTKKQLLLQEQIDQALNNFTQIGEDGIYEVQAAAALISNDSGKIEAIVGGRSQEEIGSYTLNRAYQSYRQPGSSIKPLLVYAPALENGYTKSSVLQNISVEELKKHPEKELSGPPMSLETALYRSENGPACWLFKKIGVSEGLSYLEKMHFARLMYSDQNIVSALGGFTYGTNVTEMAGAYRSFTVGGTHTDPTCITSILYDGKEIYKEPKETEVYSVKTSKEMLNLLEGVVKSGTASRLHWSASVPAVGKTGTTNGNKDGWFCGMIPDYTLSIWVGRDTPRTVHGLSGGSYPLTIFKGVMNELAKDPTRKEFAAFEKVSEEGLEFSTSVGNYEDYLPGRADEEELSPGYTVANYRQDHMLADAIDVLLVEADKETDAGKRKKLLSEAETKKEQIYGRSVNAEVEEKIRSIKQKYGE